MGVCPFKNPITGPHGLKFVALGLQMLGTPDLGHSSGFDRKSFSTTYNIATIIISVTTVIQDINRWSHCCSGTNVCWLLTSEFASSTRGERGTILRVFRIILYKQNSNARHISWSSRSPFIFVGRDPKNLIVCFNGRNPNFSTPWSELNFYCPSTWPKSTTNSTGPHLSINWAGPQ